MQYFDCLFHFVAQIVTCSISYGLWPHVVGSNEQNKLSLSLSLHVSASNRPSSGCTSNEKGLGGCTIYNVTSVTEVKLYILQPPTPYHQMYNLMMAC